MYGKIRIYIILEIVIRSMEILEFTNYIRNCDQMFGKIGYIEIGCYPQINDRENVKEEWWWRAMVY